MWKTVASPSPLAVIRCVLGAWHFVTALFAIPDFWIFDRKTLQNSRSILALTSGGRASAPEFHVGVRLPLAFSGANLVIPIPSERWGAPKVASVT